MNQPRHLQITHIPFQMDLKGNILTDEVWGKELLAKVKLYGNLTVVAPQLAAETAMKTWGPSAITLSPDCGVHFVGIPLIHSWRTYWRLPAIRRILRREVMKADVVHSSNFFPPYLGLYYAHELAFKLGKKTVYVVSEDYYDMMSWEWIRPISSFLERWKRKLILSRIENRVRHALKTASLSFLNTPSVVSRYRLLARNGEGIHHPTHETQDVMTEKELEEKCRAIMDNDPLTIVALCRHSPLKGADYLIRAIAILKDRGINVNVRIHGFGPQTDELKGLVNTLNVEDRVSILGPVPPGSAVYKAIREGHLFTMPHRTNDFGRTFYDSMCAGTPVLAFYTPASECTIKEGINGLLAPLDNAVALALRIEEINLNRPLLAAMTKNAREKGLIETQSSWLKYRYERIKEMMR